MAGKTTSPGNDTGSQGALLVLMSLIEKWSDNVIYQPYTAKETMKFTKWSILTTLFALVKMKSNPSVCALQDIVLPLDFPK